MRKKKTNLSKSKFISGKQCLKRLYLSCYERDLAGPLDEATLAIFARGDEVGALAQKAFPGGVLVEEEYWDHERAIEHTQRLMADEGVPAIFEAAFTYEDIVIRADVMERLPDGQWRLIEVKSSTEVKDVHLSDVAIQKYVLEGCGINVREACLMHLNREYVYDGVEYDLEHLFSIENLTPELSAIEKAIPHDLAEQRKTLRRRTPPAIEPGAQCTDPYVCDFYDHCNEDLPEGHVSNLFRIGDNKLEQLLTMGVEAIADIPDDFPLSETQKRIVACSKSGLPFIDDGLQEKLAGLRYPVCFMDFETINPALPRYAGMSPYSTYAFQWSVHVQKAPGARATHYEFLADNNSDPREDFLRSLLDVLESHGEDRDIVIYSAYEATQLKQLAKWLPKYAKRIARVLDRLWDLLPVVRQYTYHPKFNNSFSLKTVLPTLVPDMTYDGMPVSEGQEAGLAFERMISGTLSTFERNKTRQDLLAYCKQDTLAMVRLVEVLTVTKNYDGFCVDEKFPDCFGRLFDAKEAECQKCARGRDDTCEVETKKTVARLKGSCGVSYDGT